MSSYQPSGALAGEGGDPRLTHNDSLINAEEDHRHERDISFEEYYYYAGITRAEEKIADEEYRRIRGPRSFANTITGRFSKGGDHAVAQAQAQMAADESRVTNEKTGELNEKGEPTGEVVAPHYAADLKNASRAMRTASWGSIFYLITTDILGPFTCPWAFAQMGYGPGVALYTVFGGFSIYSGWILWKVFLGLDSDKYPMRNYAEAFMRVWGRWAMHVANIGQFIQLLLTVSILILANGQAIYQISMGPQGNAGICFIACLIIFMAAGFILGQIRTLQRFSWIANFAIWMNVFTMICLMVLYAKFPPNFDLLVGTFGPNFGKAPIKTFAGTPPPGYASGGNGFIGSLNGLNQAVYSYAGAMLFITFLAEMRHPMDFWKALLCAETFIYFCYMFFGMFIYSYQGQFTYNPIVQGLVNYDWQTALNIIQLITGLIAAALYGNVGLKVSYVEVLEKICGFPPLHTKGGKFWWIALIPLYWGLGFVVAAAIPQFSYISGLVGALFLLSFTYTFPAFLAFGFWIKKDAMDSETERFDPATHTYHYRDTGVRRFMRGFMKKPVFNTLNMLYCLGALVTTALGMYSALLGIIGAFQAGIATSFSCKPPI